MKDYWTCGCCEIKTFGDWNCEVKPVDTDDDKFRPVCKNCEIQVRENFVPAEEI